MAAPIAYEQPTMRKAWGAFVAHLPTLFVIRITAGGLSVLGGLGAKIFYSMAMSPAILGSADNASSWFLSHGFWLVGLVSVPLMMLSALPLAYVAVVPVLYFETGKSVSIGRAFGALFRRPWRYLMAGIFFQVISIFGLFLCWWPGVVVLLMGPVYAAKVFTTDLTIFAAFGSSFKAVYGSKRGLDFVVIELLVIAILLVPALLLIFVARMDLGLYLYVSPLVKMVVIEGLKIIFWIAFAVASFYIQNTAHRQGVLR